MTASAAIDAVVAGHICLDVIPDLTHVKLPGPEAFLTPGKLLNTRPATISTGGPVSNTGLAMRKLGIDAALMGKVGDDPFGCMVVDLLAERWGIDGGMIVTPGEATSYTVVLAPAGLDRMFLHCPGANNTFCADDIDYDLLAKARLLHLGYPPLMQRMYENDAAELIEIYRRAKEIGLTTSLDMSLPDPDSASGQAPWADILAELLPLVDIFLPSVEEITFMLDRQRFDEMRTSGMNMLEQVTGQQVHSLGEKLLALGGKIMVIKCGFRGIYCRTAGADRLKAIGKAKPGRGFADREFWQPTYHIDTYGSATGSGDSAIAGFLSAYLRELDCDRCLRYATANGALNVSRPDALSGIVGWDELTARLDAGWQTAPVTLEDAPGWRPDGDRWIGPAEADA